jgi:sugar lactone lactonase YvrE
MNSAGIINTFADTGSTSTAGASASLSAVAFYVPYSVVGDSAGNFYISDYQYIWKCESSTNIVSVFAGIATPGFSGDGISPTAAQFNRPKGLWLTTSGILYVADSLNHRIRRIFGGSITTAAGSSTTGSYNGDNGLATLANLNLPSAVYVDTNGRMFISDSLNFRIRLIHTNNIITTFAGTGVDVLSLVVTNNLPASSAPIGTTEDIKGDSLGNIYIAESLKHIIRVIDTDGIISTLFGSPGVGGFTSGIAPRMSNINSPNGIWIDSVGSIYFSDYNSIRQSILVSQPTSQPTSRPSRQPSARPSRQPSRIPSCQPTTRPSRHPSSQPTRQPTGRPTSQPSGRPSRQPSSQPTRLPTGQPTTEPTTDPLSKVYMQLTAGTGSAGIGGDNGPATSAQISGYIPFVDMGICIFPT